MKNPKIRKVFIEYEDSTICEISPREIFDINKALTFAEWRENALIFFSDQERYDLQQKLRDAPLCYDDWLRYAIIEKDLFGE